MKKIKCLFKKEIALLTVIMLILPTLLIDSVILADAANYGTVEDGITGNASDIAASSTFFNGDFSEGLKYWGKSADSILETDKASDSSFIETDLSGNNYLVIEKQESESSDKKGIKSVNFEISGINRNDSVFVFADYYTEISETGIFNISLKAANTNTRLSANLSLKDTSQKTSTIYTKENWKTVYLSRKFTKVSDSGVATLNLDVSFNSGKYGKLCIDNIKIFINRKDVTPEGYYEALDGTLVPESDLNTELYGDANDGVIGDITTISPTDTFLNNDFSEGLKYWGQRGGTVADTAKASDSATVKVDDSGDKYLFIDKPQAETNSFKGIKSARFKVNGLSVGDTITLLADYKGEFSGTPAFYVNLVPDSTTAFENNFQLTDGSAEVKTVYTREGWKTIKGTQTIGSISSSGSAVFYLDVYINVNKYGSVSVDNLNIYIKDNTGEDKTPAGYYKKLDGTLVPENDLNTEMYGNEENGISGNASALAPTDKLLNGDFQNGFLYWGQRGGNPSATAKASDDVSLKEESGNKYIFIERQESVNAAKGIKSVPFKINGLSVGDEIALLVDYKATPNDNNAGNPFFYTTINSLDAKFKTDKTAINVNTNTKQITTVTTPKGWTTTITTGEISEVSADGTALFSMDIYLQYKAAGEICLDNVRILVKDKTGEDKTPDGYYETLDGVLVSEDDLNTTKYGTEEDGISGNASELPATNSLLNGDFKEGFKYWGQRGGTPSVTAKASDDVSLKEENGNKYIYISRENSEQSAKGIKSVAFKIDGLSNGDEIYLLADYKAAPNAQNKANPFFYVNLNSANSMFESTKGDVSAINVNTNTKQVTTTTTAKGWVTTINSAKLTQVPSDGIGLFNIDLYLQYKGAGELNLDNIRILVKDKTGNDKTPDGYYETLDGELIPEDDLNTTKYGTEQDGIIGNAADISATDTFLNGDFQKSLMYWGKRGSHVDTTAKASDSAAIKTQGNNKYLSIERQNPENSAKGLKSVKFKIKGLSVGDQILFALDYKDTPIASNPKNEGNPYFYVSLYANGAKFKSNKNAIGLNRNSTSKYKSDAAPSGWTSVSSEIGLIESINEDGTAEFNFDIYLQYNCSGEINIDNIQVLVKRNSGDNKTKDGFYETLDGKLVSMGLFGTITSSAGSVASGANDFNPPGAVYEWIGTYEDGIYNPQTGYFGNKFPIRTSFMNGDFKYGLQYWFDKFQGYMSQAATLNKESNGNEYVTLKAGQQMNQQGFWIKDLEPGTKLYIMGKYRNGNSVTFQSYTRNALEGMHDITTIHSEAKVIYEPTNMGEWGYIVTSQALTIPDMSQLDKDYDSKSGVDCGGNFIYYMQIRVSSDTDLDDIMFVTKDSFGNYFDLKGNKIEIPKNDTSIYSTEFAWDKSNVKYKDGILQFGADNTDHIIKTSVSNDTDIAENNNNTLLVVIIVVASAVLLIGIAVLAVIIKKKKTVKKGI